MSQSIRQRRALRQYVTHGGRASARPESRINLRQSIKNLIDQLAAGLGLRRTA